MIAAVGRGAGTLQSPRTAGGLDASHRSMAVWLRQILSLSTLQPPLDAVEAGGQRREHVLVAVAGAHEPSPHRPASHRCGGAPSARGAPSEAGIFNPGPLECCQEGRGFAFATSGTYP